MSPLILPAFDQYSLYILNQELQLYLVNITQPYCIHASLKLCTPAQSFPNPFFHNPSERGERPPSCITWQKESSLFHCNLAHHRNGSSEVQFHLNERMTAQYHVLGLCIRGSRHFCTQTMGSLCSSFYQLGIWLKDVCFQTSSCGFWVSSWSFQLISGLMRLPGWLASANCKQSLALQQFSININKLIVNFFLYPNAHLLKTRVNDFKCLFFSNLRSFLTSQKQTHQFLHFSQLHKQVPNMVKGANFKFITQYPMHANPNRQVYIMRSRRPKRGVLSLEQQWCVSQKSLNLIMVNRQNHCKVSSCC